MRRFSPRLWAFRTAFGSVGRVAPGVAARWAETVFCTPPRHEPRSAEERFLASGTPFTVAWERERLAAWSWGEGPAVILVHGWGSRAGRFAALAGALIENGLRVVLYDGPAHGRSTGRFASLPEFARALGAVADAVGPVSAAVGHSLGGAAVSLALYEGMQAGRAVLLAPPADIAIFARSFAQTVWLPARAHDVMRRNLEVRLRMRWEELDVAALARRLRVPALVVHDREDPDVPFAHAEEIAGAWPAARLMATTGLGHRALLRDAEVIRATVEFLRERADP